ncbi:MAG: hypothetical protein ACRDQ0_12370, partial [Pseudonocardia sp.]
MAWAPYRQHRGVVAAAHAGVRGIDADTVPNGRRGATGAAATGATRIVMLCPLTVSLPCGCLPQGGGA